MQSRLCMWLLSVVVLSSLMLGGCAMSPLAGPPPRPQIETPNGTFIIKRAYIAESYPEGCDPFKGMGEADGCMIDGVEEGYQLLLVFIEAQPASEDTPLDTPELGAVSVTGDDGSFSASTASMFMGSTGERAIVFTPPDTATTFTLNWPDVEPIPLPLDEGGGEQEATPSE